MSEKAKKSGKNFMVQGSILAIAGVITKIIGAVYRVPLVNIYDGRNPCLPVHRFSGRR